MKRTVFALTAAVLMTSGLAFAQPAGGNGYFGQDKPNTVNERRENQQDRIAQGVRSGQLTARAVHRPEDGRLT